MQKFSKICKKFLKKVAKKAVFSPILQRNFKTMRSIFARLYEKHNCLGNFRKFAKKFLKKMAKNAVFSPILQRNFKTMRSIFARLDEKHNCLGNFEKFSKICKKIPEENGKKCCIFAYFAKEFQNHAVNFCRFGRKTQLFGKF